MAINNVVSVQQHNGGFLPYITLHYITLHYTVDPIMVLPSGNQFKRPEEVLCLQPMIPPKRFGIFLPDWGMLRR